MIAVPKLVLDGSRHAGERFNLRPVAISGNGRDTTS